MTEPADFSITPQEAILMYEQHENLYKCWSTEPLSGAVIQIRRLYSLPVNEVKSVLQELGIPNESYKVEDIAQLNYDIDVWSSIDTLPDSHMKYAKSQVTYKLTAGDLNLPTELPIGEKFNFDSLLRAIKVYEQMNVSYDKLAPELAQLAYTYYEHVYWFLDEQQKRGQIIIPIVEWESSQDEFHAYTKKGLGRNKDTFTFFSLYKAIPGLDGIPESGILMKINETILNILEESKDEEAKRKYADLLESDFFLFRDDHLGSLQPNGAIYYENWFDARFKFDSQLQPGEYSRKKKLRDTKEGPFVQIIPDDIVFGTMPSAKGVSTSTIDAGAFINLQRRGRAYVDHDIDPSRRPTLLTPPNMTNLYVVGMPCVTDEIEKIEEKLVVSDKNRIELRRDILNKHFDGRIRMIVCDLPERLNPNTVYDILNRKFGDRSWILVRKNKDGVFEHLVPKPKSEWNITSKTVKRFPLEDVDDEYHDR